MTTQWINTNLDVLVPAFLFLLIVSAGWFYMRYTAKDDSYPVTAVDQWVDMAKSDYNDLEAMLITCKSPAELDRLENKILTFENYFANLIPSHELHPLVTQLYDVFNLKSQDLTIYQR